MIESFPIDIISGLSNENAKISPPPGEREVDSFSDVFSRVTPERSASARPDSGEKEEFKGSEKGEEASAHLVGVNEPVASSPDVRPEEHSKNFLNGPGPDHGSSAEKAGASPGRDNPHSLKAVLSQLGLTPEEIKKVAGAKNPEQLKDILLKLGLDSSDAKQFAGTLKDGEEILFNKLMAALQQRETGEINKIFAELKGKLMQADNPGAGGKLQGGIKELLLKLGLKPEEVEKMGAGEKLQGGIKELLLNLGLKPEEVEKMLAGLEGKFAQVDNPGAGEKLQGGIKELLLKLGLKPEEVEKLMRGDKDTINKLNKFFVKPGLNQGESNKMLRSGNLTANDLKAFLLKIGADPGNVDKLTGPGEHSDKKMSLKELMGLLHREGENTSGLSEKEGNSAGARGNTDLNSRGEVDISSIANGDKIAGEKARVDFDQMISRVRPGDAAPRKVLEQVVKGVKIQVENGQTRARISLYPPSLGKVTMHIVTRENQVRATFFAETPVVKEIIENNLPQLRESFQQQGLKVEQFNVFVGHQPAGNQAEQQNFSNAGGPYRSAGEGLEEEEGILALEQMKKRAMGSHTVDLFI